MYIKIRDDPFNNPLTYAVFVAWLVVVLTASNLYVVATFYVIHLFMTVAVNVETFKLFGTADTSGE